MGSIKLTDKYYTLQLIEFTLIKNPIQKGQGLKYNIELDLYFKM
jgi:hypothetical protein